VRVTRIPLNTFAIGLGLGLAGLAEAWSGAAPALNLWPVVTQVLWVVAAAGWVWLIVAHTVQGARSEQRLVDQLRHPAQGPIAALVPVTGMLLGAELLAYSEIAGRVLVLASVAAAAVFAAWIVARWLQGGLELEAVHGGYLLPTVAAGFVAAEASAEAGFTGLGWGAFGVGAFFWVVMSTLVILRLTVRATLPDPLVPTMAILVAPPAVAGLAWFALAGPTVAGGGTGVDVVPAMLAGLGELLLFVQLALVPRYRRLAFSLGFWSFTFPAAAVVGDASAWLGITQVPGWRVVTGVLLAVLTVLVVGVAGRSLVLVWPVRSGGVAGARVGAGVAGSAGAGAGGAGAGAAGAGAAAIGREGLVSLTPLQAAEAVLEQADDEDAERLAEV
jgi:tellurite resistance protein